IVQVGCTQISVRDNGDGGRQVLVQTPTYGSGSTHLFMTGLAYTVGPYRFRAVGGFQRESTNSLRRPVVPGGPMNFITGCRGHSSGTVFLFGHDLYVWSPKGFLTGSAETPGSILFGQHFERTNVFCGGNGQSATQPFSCTGAQFNRNRILLRE